MSNAAILETIGETPYESDSLYQLIDENTSYHAHSRVIVGNSNYCRIDEVYTDEGDDAHRFYLLSTIPLDKGYDALYPEEITNYFKDDSSDDRHYVCKYLDATIALAIKQTAGR